MKRVTLRVAGAVVAMVMGLTGYATAQIPNASETTILTFSGAVEMPGTTLPAGTYVFKLGDPVQRNTVVQVWDKDQENMIGQWFFVPARRSEASDETLIMFKEAEPGGAPAVQYWFYPNQRYGREFIYPKDQAMRIAARTGSNVLAADGAADAVNPNVSSVDARGNVTEWKPEPAEPAEQQADTAAPTTIAGNGFAQPAPEPEPQPQAREAIGTSGVAESQVARADVLPATASPLHLTALIGLMSLASAFALGLKR